MFAACSLLTRAHSLDARFESTGSHLWYTRYCGAEIVLHVAHEIPYTERDVQQVERKRHIGNDIVVIVFREPGACVLRVRVVDACQVLNRLIRASSNRTSITCFSSSRRSNRSPRRKSVSDVSVGAHGVTLICSSITESKC
jgi:hypothetical protein